MRWYWKSWGNIIGIYNTLVLPTFLYGSENWTLTASQRRGTDTAEMKLLRPLAGYTLYDHKTNDYIHCELQITGVLVKIDKYTCKECHKTESLWNHTTTDHKEGEQLEDWRNVGESGCNFGDGTGQRVQSLMFIMIIIIGSSSSAERWALVRICVLDVNEKHASIGL